MTCVAMLHELRPTAHLTDAELDLLLSSILGTDDGSTPSNGAVAASLRGGPVLACAMSGGAVAAIALLAVSPSQAPRDFLTYRYGVILAERGADLYSGTIVGPMLSGQPFTYPPVASVLLWPTTWGSWRVAYDGWCLASMVVLGAVLARAVPLRSGRRTVAVVLVAVGVASTTDLLSRNLAMGQVNLLLMGLCLADAGRRDDSRLGRVLPRGVLVGAAVAIKITPALFVGYFLITRQWRLARWSIGAAVTVTAAGWLLRPEMSRSFFGSAIWRLDDRVNLVHPAGYAGNTSVTGAMHAIGGAAAALATPAAVAVGLLGLVAARQVHRGGREYDAWLVVGLTAPLASPFSWDHHHVYVLPAVLVIATKRERGPGRWGAAMLIAVVIALHFSPLDGDRWLHEGNWWSAVAGALVRENVLLVALGCIVALAITSVVPARQTNLTGRASR